MVDMIASPSPEYSKIWIRDAVYIALGLEAEEKIKELQKIYHTLLDILLIHENKIDWAIVEKPKYAYQYIHARYNPVTLGEYEEEWGNKQNDAIGLLMFKIGDLEKKGIKILRNSDDIRILQKLVFYLNSIKYWEDKDNGMWEENEELHASSVGACLAGLTSVQHLVIVPKVLIEKGQEALNKLLPKESATKNADLALLSLIYPLNIVSISQTNMILERAETLIRKRGVIRYVGDKYYNKKGEAEWTMGLLWLSICYKITKNSRLSRLYLAKTLTVLNKDGDLPELYYSNSGEHNKNCPLAWTESLFKVANELQR